MRLLHICLYLLNANYVLAAFILVHLYWKCYLVTTPVWNIQNPWICCVTCRYVVSCCRVVITHALRHVILVNVLHVLASAGKLVLAAKPVCCLTAVSYNVSTDYSYLACSRLVAVGLLIVENCSSSLHMFPLRKPGWLHRKIQLSQQQCPGVFT